MTHVLVVDDSGVMRKIIARSLGKVGVSMVTEAADGREGLATFTQHHFDLVLTDWNMPVRNGLELVRDIRATGSDVPIFMITTEADRERVLEALQAGANDYLTKPFDTDVLREKLTRFVFS